MKSLVISLLALIYFNSAFASSACMDDDLVLAATGDMLFHGALYVQAFKNDSRGDFETLWGETTPYLQQADLMYTNLEGAAAPGLYSDGTVDTSLSEVYHATNNMYSIGAIAHNFSFNFHPESVRALARAGFTLLSTSNNHTLDRRVKGINMTIDFLNENNFDHFGTKKAGQSDDSFVRIIHENNMSIAFLSCTYGSNSRVVTDQLLHCYDNKAPNQKLLGLVKKYSQQVDIVMVTPHWGTEYAEKANSKQKRLAKALVAAGAKAIFGHHPHVVQPVEYLTSPRGLKVPVLYSLGNFVTNQSPTDWKDKAKNEIRFRRRVGASAFIGFSYINGVVSFSNLKLMPTYMKTEYQGERGVRKLLPAYKQMYSKKNLVGSLDKAMKYFSAKFSNDEGVSYEQIKNGIVCN